MLGSLGIQMVRSKAVWLFTLVVLAATVGLLVIPGRGDTAEPALAGTSLHGKSAPDFRLTDQFGRRISLSQFRGHPVVVTFLESHCRETCPLVADKLRQAVTILGAAGRQVAILVVSTDPEGDRISAVRQFSRAHGMLHRWRYLVGSRQHLSRVWHAYYIYAAPKDAPPAIRDAHTSATYLIDRQGREQILLTGDPDEQVLVRDLQTLAGLPVTLPPEGAPAPEVRHPAPDFKLSALAGQPISLQAFRGRVVLLNFWATWCTPCRTEMPMLARWYRQMGGQRFVVLGVDQQEGRGDIQAFVRRLHIPYPIALDESGAVSARYDVVGLPTSFVLDRSGIIRAVHIGILGAGYLSQQIMPLLQEQTHG